MKNKKIIIAIVATVCIILIAIGVATTFNTSVFQSEDEMSEIINGKWVTGNTEYDFIITIQGDSMIMEVGNTSREPEEYHINIIPDKGYFYTDTSKDNLYKLTIQNGRYVIKTDKWTYEKVE